MIFKLTFHCHLCISFFHALFTIPFSNSTITQPLVDIIIFWQFSDRLHLWLSRLTVLLVSANEGGGSQKHVQKCSYEWKQFKSTVYHCVYHRGYSFQPYLTVKFMDIWLSLWYYVVCRWLRLILEQLVASIFRTEVSRQKIHWKHPWQMTWL